MNLFTKFSMTASLRNATATSFIWPERSTYGLRWSCRLITAAPGQLSYKCCSYCRTLEFNAIHCRGNCSAAVNVMSITVQEVGMVHLGRVDSQKSLLEYSDWSNESWTINTLYCGLLYRHRRLWNSMMKRWVTKLFLFK